ncbi:MAG: hypothetical protein AAFU80_16280 [Pseudomonadota bacterium]
MARVKTWSRSDTGAPMFQEVFARVTDMVGDGLREIGLTDKGIVRLVHPIGDFAACSRRNLALPTDYDYRDTWRDGAFAWKNDGRQPDGNNKLRLRA